MKKLNLGCGKDIKKSFINLDNIKLKGVDIIHDINKFPYPFKDNEFDEILCSHILEHVEDIIKTLRELNRITKNKGKIKIRSPHFSSGVGYWDLTHKRFFSYFSFDYFQDDCHWIDIKFKILKRKINYTRLNFTFLNYFMNPIVNASPLLYERFFCWMIPSSEVIFILQVEK
tara:strand:- start:343 stop:858 length:516 start_codon:yes stop_codon:yes gene_type:complete